VGWAGPGRDGGAAAVSGGGGGGGGGGGNWDGCFGGGQVWGTADGAERLALAGHARGVWSVAYSPDGSLLAAGGDDGTVRVWAAADGAPRLVVVAGAPVAAVAFSRDGALLASGGGDGALRLWDPRTGAPRAEPAPHGWPVTSVAFAPDGNTAAAAAAGGTVTTWDLVRREDRLALAMALHPRLGDAAPIAALGAALLAAVADRLVA
jgi:WD40 repeat protein